MRGTPLAARGGAFDYHPRVSTWIRRLIIVLVLAAAAAGAWYWFRPDPIPVSVRLVERGRVEETVTNSKAGTIRTRRRASISPQIGGRVADLPVREGDRVKAGDVLLRISDEDLRAQSHVSRRAIETAEAAVAEACTTAEQARRDTARLSQLAAENIVSADRLEQAKAKEEAAVAACEAARANVAQAQAGSGLSDANLAKTVVRAPFSGVVAEVRAEIGEFISPQMPGVFMQPVIDLIDDTDLYVSAPLDEVDVGRVSVGLPVRITLDPYPDRPLTGTVARVAPYVEDAKEQSRTFEVEVAISADVPEGVVLKPGATADIEVILDARDGVLRVPSYALMQGDDVLVVRDGVLDEVHVKPGLRNWEFVEIQSGLSEGDPVVVSLDRAEVKAGAHVTVTEGAAK